MILPRGGLVLRHSTHCPADTAVVNRSWQDVKPAEQRRVPESDTIQQSLEAVLPGSSFPPRRGVRLGISYLYSPSVLCHDHWALRIFGRISPVICIIYRPSHRNETSCPIGHSILQYFTCEIWWWYCWLVRLDISTAWSNLLDPTCWLVTVAHNGSSRPYADGLNPYLIGQI